MGSKKDGKTKVEVAERALLARINRLLAESGERIVRSRPLRGKLFRGKPVYPDVGRYYRVSGKARAVVGRDLDLGAVARELDLLKSWEIYSPPVASEA